MEGGRAGRIERWKDGRMEGGGRKRKEGSKEGNFITGISRYIHSIKFL